MCVPVIYLGSSHPAHWLQMMACEPEMAALIGCRVEKSWLPSNSMQSQQIAETETGWEGMGGSGREGGYTSRSNSVHAHVNYKKAGSGMWRSSSVSPTKSTNQSVLRPLIILTTLSKLWEAYSWRSKLHVSIIVLITPLLFFTLIMTKLKIPDNQPTSPQQTVLFFHKKHAELWLYCRTRTSLCAPIHLKLGSLSGIYIEQNERTEMMQSLTSWRGPTIIFL